MSIATAITNLQGKIANAYTAIENKGGTLPATQNAANLATAIGDIPSGGDAKRKYGATIDDVFYNPSEGVLQLNGGVENLNFTGISSVSLPYGFTNCTSLKSVSFPDVTTIGENGMQYAFADCSNLSSVSIPKLTTIGSGGMAYAFDNCTSLTDFSFTSLSTYEGAIGSNDFGFLNCFIRCSNLSSLSFPELSSVKGRNTFGNMMENCTKLPSVSFPKLERVYYSPFWNAFNRTNISAMCFPELSGIYNGATNASNSTFGAGSINTTWPIQRFDFPKLKVISTTANDDVNCTYLFANQKNLVEIHFGAENQTIIEGCAGYATKWGAPNANCQIYFDL